MQLRTLAFGTIAVASYFFVACHQDESQAPQGSETQLRAGATPGAHACPMSVAGTTVSASDSASGAVLELSTTAGPSEVAELQRRAHAMAEGGSLGMMRGPGGGRGQAGRALARETSGAARPRTRLEDTPKGVRVMLEPGDPQGVDALRARVRAHASRMAGNEACMRARTTH